MRVFEGGKEKALRGRNGRGREGKGVGEPMGQHPRPPRDLGATFLPKTLRC